MCASNEIPQSCAGLHIFYEEGKFTQKDKVIWLKHIRKLIDLLKTWEDLHIFYFSIYSVKNHKVLVNSLSVITSSSLTVERESWNWSS